VYSAAIPQRADMVLERCTNAVATPFGVTGSYSRNIPMAEKQIVCFQSKKSENI